MTFSKLSIVIPAYNEGKTIHLILDKIKQVELLNGIEKEVIIVNDCSTDNTVDAIREYMSTHDSLPIHLHNQEQNQGKGAALHKGISLATGDYIVIQDADLEYDPNEYNLLIKPILDGFADVVYGSRFLGGNAHRILFFWHTIGNKFLTFLSNMFTNLNLSDMETCYKMFRRDIIQSLDLQEKRFGFEPEVTAKIARVKDVRIYEVGISYYGRTFAEGKKIGWKDGFRAIYCIIKYNYKHFRIFKHFSSFIIALILLFSVFYSINHRIKGNDGVSYTRIIQSDGRGYYLYLPTVFIYGDYHYNFVGSIEQSLGFNKYSGDYLLEFEGIRVNRYPIGLAVIWLPFFLIAYFLSFLFGINPDGYNILFQISILVASLFYLTLGLVFLRKLLKKYPISEMAIGISFIFIFFATNLFEYALMECSLTHVYSFSIISIWSYLVYSISREFNFNKLLWVAFLFGLIISIRPSNGIVILFLPFLAGSFNQIKALFKNFLKPNIILASIISFMIVPLLQIIFWKYQSGQFFLNTYSLDGLFLDFTHPYIPHVLFSYKKGLFVYTPIIIITIIGIYHLYKRFSFFVTLSYLLGFLSALFVIASWPVWWYGGSYGMRPFIDYYALLTIPMACAFSVRNKIWKYLLISIGSVFLIINQIQIFQYNNFILHCEQMDKASYWKVFLKTSDQYKGILYNTKKEIEVGERTFFNRWTNNFDTDIDWGNNHTITEEVFLSNPKSVHLSKVNNFGPTLILQRSELGDSSVVIKVICRVKISSDNHQTNIVVSTEDQNNSIYYDNYSLNYLTKSDEWKEIKANFFIPAKQSESELAKIYFYCTDGKIYIDDLSIEAYH